MEYTDPIKQTIKRAKVIVLGGVSYNTMVYLIQFPEPRSQTLQARGYHETVGSTGAGKALNLHRLGLDVTLYGLIGEDEYGHWARSYLSDRGIRFVYEIDPAGTKRHVNLMDDYGGRISIFIVPGSLNPDIDLSLIEELVVGCDYAALNIINYCRLAIPILKKHHIPIWCDIHDYNGQDPYCRDFIEAADVLFLSSGGMPDYEAFMRRMIGMGKALVVCTHGRDGATTLTSEGVWLETPIIPYPEEDSNGAGDSFFAGVLYGHSRGYPIERCLNYGAIVAGLCVTSRELAFPGLSMELVEQEYGRIFGG